MDNIVTAQTKPIIRPIINPNINVIIYYYILDLIYLLILYVFIVGTVATRDSLMK